LVKTDQRSDRMVSLRQLSFVLILEIISSLLQITSGHIVYQWRNDFVYQLKGQRNQKGSEPFNHFFKLITFSALAQRWFGSGKLGSQMKILATPVDSQRFMPCSISVRLT